jgi:hypothetical protein
MPDPKTIRPRLPKPIGIAANHGSLELEQYLLGVPREERFSGAERHRWCWAKISVFESHAARILA